MQTNSARRHTLPLKRVRLTLISPAHNPNTCHTVIAYNTSLPSLPVLPKIQPGYLAPLLPANPPESPEPWSTIQPDIASKIMPGLTHWQSPNFMAFFPACATYPSLLGEMYSAAFTAPAFNWLCSPACTELETIVLDWLAKAFALPDVFLSTSPNGGGGVIQGSASEAIVTCMVAARERYLDAKCNAEGLAHGSRERDDRIAFLRGRLVALSSDQAHSSTQKGALIAGTRYKSIPTSYADDLALTGPALQKALDECAAEGLEPYYLTTTLGTTSTCAVDDFAAIGSVKTSSAPNLWIHIDAAYAGAALICPEHQHHSKLFTIGDSFDMNMHKWLLVNFDASCLYVQNRNDLTRALSITPSYLQNKHTDSGLVTDYRDWQIPLGRRFRALKIWFVMRSYGLEGMQAHIRKTERIGDVFATLVRQRQDLFEIIAPPRFALTCFRIKPSIFATRGASAMNGHAMAPNVTRKISADADILPTKLMAEQAEADANVATKQIADLVNERGEVFITSSVAAGKTMIRVVSGNPNAEEKYVRNAFEIILRTAEEVLEARERRMNGVAN
jgi:aromatic-L-amino-acid/L-tryptophan decarboxylase